MVPFNPETVDLIGLTPYEEWTDGLKFRDWILIKTKGFEASVDYLGETYPTYEFQLFIDRIPVTLLLTVVAYTFIASENLPVLSYLTFVDAYLVVSFFICVVSVLGTVVFRLLTGVEYDDDDILTLKMHRASKLTGLVLFCVYASTVWFLYQIV